MRYFWSFLLITLGVLIFGSSMGWWTGSFADLWRFWPLILIFIGLDLLTTNLRIQPLIMIVAFVLAALFVWDIAFSPKPILLEKKNAVKTTESKISVDVPSGIKESDVKIETGAITFDISGKTSKLADGLLTTNVSQLDLSTEVSDKIAKTTISTNANFQNWFPFVQLKNNLKLALSDKLPLNLRVNSGASTMNFNLSDYILKNLIIKSGASTIKVRIGEKTLDGSEINVDAGAATIEVNVPKNLGVKIVSDSGLTTNEFNGFTKNGDVWESEGYGTAKKKILITFKSGASTIKVNRY